LGMSKKTNRFEKQAPIRICAPPFLCPYGSKWNFGRKRTQKSYLLKLLKEMSRWNGMAIIWRTVEALHRPPSPSKSGKSKGIKNLQPVGSRRTLYIFWWLERTARNNFFYLKTLKWFENHGTDLDHVDFAHFDTTFQGLRLTNARHYMNSWSHLVASLYLTWNVVVV